MSFRVEITARAEQDIETNFAWLRARDEDAADQWLSGIQETIRSLEEMPERCALAFESRAFEPEIRQLLYGKRASRFRILFTVSAGVVQVLHVRHHRQAPVDLP